VNKKIEIYPIVASIKKWRRIRDYAWIDEGRDNCRLCMEFPYRKNNHKVYICHDIYGRQCPVYSYTNQPDCSGTPYTAWRIHQAKTNNHHREKVLYGHGHKCKICTYLANEEIKFLVQLIRWCRRR
jgi:hypothetical protein